MLYNIAVGSFLFDNKDKPGHEETNHLSTCRGKPLADLETDMTHTELSRHWTFGHSMNFNQITPFNSIPRDGSLFWSCNKGYDTTFSYPNFFTYVLHPCADTSGKKSCCGKPAAQAHAMFTSWFDLRDVTLIVGYTSCAACGDGVNVQCMPLLFAYIHHHAFLSDCYQIHLPIH